MGKLGTMKKKIAKKVVLDKKRPSVFLMSKERCAKLIEEAAQGGFIVDFSRRIVFVNALFCRMLGYSKEEMKGMNLDSFHAKEDLPYALTQFEKITRGEIALVKEMPVRRKDGNIFYADVNGFPVIFSGKKYVVGFFEDVTEQKNAQEKLKQSEEMFAKTFKASPVLMSITTVEEGRIIEVNDYFLKFFNYKREEVVGKTTLELNLYVNSDQRASFIQLIKAQGFVRDFEVQLRISSGEFRTTLFSLEMIELQNEKYLITVASDITEYKKTEKELVSRNAFIKKALDSLSHSFYVIDAENYKILMANKASGIDVSKNITCHAAIHRTDKPCEGEHVCPLKIVKETKKEMIVEHIHYDEEGNKFNFEVHGYPIFDDNGEVMQMIEYSLDVTERKQAVAALRQSEERYRLLAENANDVIWTMDLNGQFTYFSPSVYRQRGYTSEEAVVLTMGQTLTPASLMMALKIFNESVARVKAGQKQEPIQMELEHYCKDGSVIWCDLTCSVLCDLSKNVIGFMGITRNTTERKHAEVALRESEQRYRLLADNISDIIFVMGLNMQFTYFSPSVKRKFGFTPEEMLLKRVDEVLTPDSFQYVLSVIADELEKERSDNVDLQRVRVFEVQEYCKDGSLIDVEISATFLRDDQKCPIEILGVIRDIRERKRIEKELRESYQNLETKVKLRTIEFEAANQKLVETSEELKRAMKTKSDFLANMSHELRTPLNSINGFSEVLFDETFGPINIKQKEYLRYILISGKHLLSLINDVLDMAKMEAGKEVLLISVVFMKDLLEESVALVQEMAIKKNIVTCLDLSQDLGTIDADERKIKEVVYNLFANAIKFTPDGGRIKVWAVRTASEIEVAIQDNGIGISKENMAKIFEAFVRLDNPFTRLTEGTGLGLVYSRKLIELHGGKIWVESEGVGKGSIFKFTVPIKAK